MARSRWIALVTASALLALAIMVSADHVSAHGFGGRLRGDRELWLLTRAAGVSRAQISAAFKADSNLGTRRSNLKNARKALVTCLASGGSCTSQISAYGGAVQALAEEKANVWLSLFKGAPSPGKSSAALVQLEQVRVQRRQVMQQIFGFALGPAEGTSDLQQPLRSIP